MSHHSNKTWLAAVSVKILGMYAATMPLSLAQDKTERLFWENVRCHEEMEVRVYLEEFPKGAYVDEAIECLRSAGRDDVQDEVGTQDEIADAREPFEPEMVAIEGGCFQMGSPESESGRGDDESRHEVCVEDLAIGKYEVTQAEWNAVMDINLSHFKGADRPVERVSWHDAQEYIAKLNARTGRSYRLPTEVEWEYACRSGGQAQKYCGGSNLEVLAWYSDNSSDQTHPVGGKQANSLGLHDMSGNVSEWTCSAYDDGYGGAERRCAGDGAAEVRVLRGGSWNNFPRYVRAASRFSAVPGKRNYFIGFRLAHD